MWIGIHQLERELTVREMGEEYIEMGKEERVRKVYIKERGMGGLLGKWEGDRMGNGRCRESVR